MMGFTNRPMAYYCPPRQKVCPKELGGCGELFTSPSGTVKLCKSCREKVTPKKRDWSKAGRLKAELRRGLVRRGLSAK